MKWLELIRVRSARPVLQAALPELESHVAALAEGAPEAETLLLTHALYDGDLAIAVVWRNQEAPAKTRDGLLVAEQLARLGSVDHAVWIPTP